MSDRKKKLLLVLQEIHIYIVAYNIQTYWITLQAVSLPFHVFERTTPLTFNLRFDPKCVYFRYWNEWWKKERKSSDIVCGSVYTFFVKYFRSNFGVCFLSHSISFFPWFCLCSFFSEFFIIFLLFYLLFSPSSSPFDISSPKKCVLLLLFFYWTFMYLSHCHFI